MLDEEHLMGAGREAGDRLCQFVLEEGQPVAVLVWCAAAWHLKGRDDRIGWDAVTRAQRLMLLGGIKHVPHVDDLSVRLASGELAVWLQEGALNGGWAPAAASPERCISSGVATCRTRCRLSSMWSIAARAWIGRENAETPRCEKFDWK